MKHFSINYNKFIHATNGLRERRILLERDWLLHRASEKPMNRTFPEALHSPRKQKEKGEKERT
jgi:hypothetical protein